MSYALGEMSRITQVIIFFSGIYMATFLASSLIFFNLWRRVGDRLFLFFSLSCFVLAIERIPLLFVSPTIDDGSWVYFFRLTAFVLILVAVIDTNRVKSK